MQTTTMPARVAENLRVMTSVYNESKTRCKAANTALRNAELKAQKENRNFSEVAKQYNAALAEYNKYVQI